ncbi:MAG: hypothetical protein QOJ16_1173, partial [Acidobacteriota bacterium]|nr:hypothetical protein [Acidobacteriota bacterium]
MHYRDFELRIRSDPQGNLWTDLVRSPFGVADAPFLLPFANGMAQRLLERTLRDAPRREAGGSAAEERHFQAPGPVRESELPSPREVGGALFEALLAGNVAKRFAEARAGAQASAEEEGVRILLSYHPDDPNLAPVTALPWELLAEPGGGRFLARALRTPFTRHPLIEGPPIRPRSGPLRLLVVRSAPANLPALDLAGELQRL